MLNNIFSSLQHWKGSSPSKGMPQEIEQYNYTLVNTFILKTIPCLELEVLSRTEAALRELVKSQRNLLRFLVQWSMNSNVVYGYSLRFLYTPSRSKGQTGTVKVYLLGRVSSNSEDLAARARKSQADYINSIVKVQPYKFEFDEQHDWRKSWLSESSSISCNEIVKREEVFLLNMENQWYFYTPGTLQVNESNTMIALLKQLQSYDQDVCIDITLVPTSLQDSEKAFLSRYIETLTQVIRGDHEDITPDSNAHRAKAVYEEARKLYFSNPVFLYSFRVFSSCQSTCQNFANQVVSCCTASGENLVTSVPDEAYAVQTALQVNINHQTCNSEIWSEKQNIRVNFKPPRMLKRLHRIVGIDEASAFFRLPVPMGRSCPGLEYALPADENAVKNEFPLKLEIQDIVEQYTSLITEDTYVVGIDQKGNPCVSDFSKIPHRIVAGTPGSGKTNFLTSVIYQFLHASAKIGASRNIYIADFKAGIDYHKIERRCKDIKLVTKAEDLSSLLLKLYQEYERRLELMLDEDVESLRELGEKRGGQEHRILLFIDEAATLLTVERKHREEISKHLQELAAKSRVTDINIFYCSQRPTPDVIPRLISDNMDDRVIFRVSSSASQLLLDDDMAAELPADPKGRAVYRGLESTLKVVATPYVSKSVWEQFLE